MLTILALPLWSFPRELMRKKALLTGSEEVYCSYRGVLLGWEASGAGRQGEGEIGQCKRDAEAAGGAGRCGPCFAYVWHDWPAESGMFSRCQDGITRANRCQVPLTHINLLTSVGIAAELAECCTR